MVDVKQFLKRRDNTGLERRGKAVLSFLAVAIIVTEVVLILLAFSYNGLVNHYDQLVNEDLDSSHELSQLQMREHAIAQYLQIRFIKQEEISTRSTVDKYILGWDRLLEEIEQQTKGHVSDEALSGLKKEQQHLRIFYESIFDALHTSRLNEAQSVYLSPEFQNARQLYKASISEINHSLTKTHMAHVEDERTFFTSFVILLAFVIPLVLSIWFLASRAVAAAEARVVASQMERAIEPKTIKKTTTIHEGYAKNRMLANISHEIRTPMNSIVGLVALLLDSNIGVEEREYAKSINGSAHLLLNLIDDVLVLSKMESGKLDLELKDFDLRLCMEDTIEVLGILAEDQGLECTCMVNMNVPYQLRGDPLRLRQIIINLVGELMKYSDKGEISVRVALKEETENHVTLNTVIVNTDPLEAKNVSNMMASIKESGSKTSAEILEKHGLAVGVTKQLLDLMDGSFDVHMENDKPIFYFDATFEKQYEDTLSEQDVCKELEGKRVLVAESNSFVRGSICELLRNWGCHAFEALDSTSTQKALKVAVEEDHQYDILLVDMNLEGSGGNALVRKINEQPKFQDLICIMMIPQGEHMQKQEIGLAALVSKPIMQSRLYDVMSKAARRKEGSERNRTNFIADAKLDQNIKDEYRVLLAEDNAVNQKLTLRLLERCGYKAVAANNGEEVLEKLEEDFFDLILMDCQMPVMDGYAATAKIREDEKKKRRIPIIAMTANAMKGDKERCLEVGMDDYIAKPIKIDDLVEKLQQWLRNDEDEGGDGSALERGSERRRRGTP